MWILLNFSTAKLFAEKLACALTLLYQCNKDINKHCFSGIALQYEINFVKESFVQAVYVYCQRNVANENFAEENCFSFTRTQNNMLKKLYLYVNYS